MQHSSIRKHQSAPWSRRASRWLLPCAVLLGCCSKTVPTAPPAAFTTGQTQRLSVQLESKLSGGALTFATADKRYELRGTAVLLPLSVSDSETRIRLQLEGLTLETANPDEQAALQQLLAPLAEPAVFTLRGGSAHDLRVSPGMQLQAYGWLRTLVSALQWPDASAAAAEIEEEDATGQYHARLEPTESGLRKVKTRYVKLFSRGVSTPSVEMMPQVSHSEQTRSPARGALSRVTVDETVRVPMVNAKQLEVTTRVWLSALPRGSSAVLTAEQLAAAERALAGLSVFTPPAPREGAFDAERIARATLDSVLAEIEQLGPISGADAGAGSAVSSAYLERFSLIAAMLRQRPRDVERAAELIRSGNARTPMLLQALSSAATEQTQALLREFATGEDSVSEQTRAVAATSLLRVQQPAEPTLQLLMRWAHDPKLEEHGLYGLGTAARHLRERGQTQRAREIADWLGEELRKAKEPARVERVLRGIANSADGQLFEPVRTRAAAADAGIRTAALDALRFMEHPGVDGLLLERARLEQNTHALRALQSTLSARKSSAELARALAELTADRQPYGVRFAAVEQAGKWQEERPELRALLERVGHGDEREEVRVLALGLLKPAGKDML
jgi:hypothetical protein